MALLLEAFAHLLAVSQRLGISGPGSRMLTIIAVVVVIIVILGILMGVFSSQPDVPVATTPPG